MAYLFSARYEHGQLVHVATRGDGEVGEQYHCQYANLERLPSTILRPVRRMW